MVNVKKLGYIADRATGSAVPAAGTGDTAEAFLAFGEKRPPAGTGR